MASAKAAKTASAKEKKNPKKQVSDIVAENEQLLQDLTRVQNELTETKQKLSRVLMKLTDCTDRK
jgi:predicted nuclease with TOPRIM domain